MVLFIILFIDWWIFILVIYIMVFIFIFNNVSLYYGRLSYSLGIDIISYWIVLLTFWIISLIIIARFKVKIDNYFVEFLLILFLLTLFLFLSFTCRGLFYYYLWFESRIIPTLFLIFGWGYQPERLVAGIYLLFYTLFASFPLLLCIFYINKIYGSLFYGLMAINFNLYIYLSLILAFLVKIPIFLFHFWLPKAHVEAPVSGSIILAGVLLKLGGYGLYRTLNFIFPFGIQYNYIWVIIRLYGSVFIGLLCLCQVDIKSIIAYSSVSHMGLVIGGLIVNNSIGLWGSFIIILGHGICSSGIFALANLLYERTHSRRIIINKGFILIIPTISIFWFLLRINNISSPPSLNLLGEVILIKRIISWSRITYLFLGLSSFLRCCYSIYLYSITQHGSLFRRFNFSRYGNVREYTLLIYHWFPLNILFLKSDIFSLWL